MKKLFSLLLACTMVLGIAAGSTFAAETPDGPDSNVIMPRAMFFNDTAYTTNGSWGTSQGLLTTVPGCGDSVRFWVQNQCEYELRVQIYRLDETAQYGRELIHQVDLSKRSGSDYELMWEYDGEGADSESYYIRISSIGYGSTFTAYVGARQH